MTNTQTIAPVPVLAAAPRRRFLTLPNCLTLLYIAIAIPFLLRHALWRDEAQAYLIARDSPTVSALLYNLRYEGHPPLWHFLLWILTRITVAPEAMQFLHLAIAAATVYLVTRFAPFPPLAKLLFPFGYFTFFEYGLVSRNYQLILFLSILICITWSRRRTDYLSLGLFIALLALSHAFGMILGAAFALIFLLDALALRHFSWKLPVGILIAAAGTALALKVIIPPPDSGFAPGWHFDNTSYASTLSTTCHAYFPFSQNNENFWNETAFFQTAQDAATCGVIFASFFLLLTLPSWRAFLFLLISDLGLLLFFHVKSRGGWRHHGILFVALLAALWICYHQRAGRIKTVPWKIWWHASRASFTLLLLLHAAALAVPLYYCWKYPFSASRQAAAALNSVLKPDDILVSGNQIISTSLVAYVPHRTFYFPVPGRWGTFTIWDQTPWMDAGTGDILPFARRQSHRVLIIRCWNDAPIPNTTLIGNFPAGIEGIESFHIYAYQPRPRPAPTPFELFKLLKPK